MTVEQIYTGCLAQGAYYILSGQEAAIIDPLRETAPYMKRLARDGAKLKFVFETHFHADFVSGHIDLSAKSGASIVYGPQASPEFEAIIAKDNQIFEIGNVKIKVLHTPGHTLESTCYLLMDENGKERALFSGDTLFLGEVGRPDLAQKSAMMSQEELAGMLYESLYLKILTLPDDIVVYPAHGAGSACGKNMMKETVDTLGNQKRVNYALKQPNKASFIEAVTDGLLPPPAYFGMNVAMNKKGYDSFDKVLDKGLRALNADVFEQVAENAGALILDTRNNGDFAKGFIPNSINIGLRGDFAPWVGALIMDVKQVLLLVTEPGTEEEAVTRLSRVGFDKVAGYLDGGFATWEKTMKETDLVHRITANVFSCEFNPASNKVIDLRRESEYQAGHLKNAQNRPLAYINNWIKELDREEHFYLYCAGGYRSMMAASILQSRAYRNFTEIEGGFKSIAETNLPKTGFAAQS